MAYAGMPPGRRPCIVGLAGCAAMLLLPARARAWGFAEHTALGRDGYRDACGQLVDDLKLPAQLKTNQRAAICDKATDTATVRWCLACLTYSPTLYGQSVAIAGDHVGSPEELMSVQGQRVATNLTDYVFLALVNIEHFHPAAPRNWRTHHDRALELAIEEIMRPARWPATSPRRSYASAFADHFLQDAFSAGHAGFNRAASGAAASMAFHDIWNRAGRVVKSPTGECWLQYGDGKLGQLSDFGAVPDRDPPRRPRCWTSSPRSSPGSGTARGRCAPSITSRWRSRPTRFRDRSGRSRTSRSRRTRPARS